MYWKKIGLATITIFTFCFTLNSQLNFKALELGKVFNSGTPMSCADINGDQLPDLITIHNAFEVWIGLNTGTLQFLWQKLDEIPGFVWSVNVADLDNNSFNDIILSGEFFGIITYYQDQSGFTRKDLDSFQFFSQAATLFDIDQDAYLDFTICDELAKTRFYKNNGNQSFQLDTQIINFRINETDSEAGNYGCIWSDIDGDRDPDLYISRCRPDVKDSSDRRRRNLFYHNDHGTFIEEGALRKIGILDQSWVSDIGDLDGDGLQDLVVINHYSASNIFRQTIDHHFENITAQSGFNFIGTPIQLSLQDFDNDMDLDILIAGDSCEIWLNNGKGYFTRTDKPFLNHPISSFCIADFNQDGMQDFYASFSDLVNTPNIVRDRLFILEKNTNNYIGFMLQGKQSNRNGIGAQLKIYTKGIAQFRELRCGESFGIQNSHQVHFGLGLNETIDSLIVLWPSGTENRYYNIKSNDYYLLTENTCISKKIELYPTNKITLCNNNELELRAQPGLNDLIWNTGDSTSDLHIDKTGIYFYNALDKNNCPVISKSLYVEYNPIENPQLNINGPQLICSGEELELEVPGYTDVAWDDNSTIAIRKINESGMYYARVKGACDVFLTDTLTVEKIAVIPEPIVRDTTILLPGPVLLESDQEKTRWFNNVTDIVPVFEGREYFIPLISKTTQLWAERYDTFPFPIVNAGMPEPKYVFSPFHVHTLNGGLFFNVQQDCILESVVVYTDRIGKRRILLLNENLETIDSIEFNLTPGMNLLQLNFSLSVSQKKYYLTTSSAVNKIEFLTISPWLYRSEIEVSYPIKTNDVCTILYSGSGESEYQYFYDWKIKLLDKECTSNRIPVNIIVESISTSEFKKNLSDYFSYHSRTIYFSEKSDLDYLIISDAKGVEFIKCKNYKTNVVHLENIPSGLYFIQFKLKHSNIPVQGKIFIE